jgi:hypothetical protein
VLLLVGVEPEVCALDVGLVRSLRQA